MSDDVNENTKSLQLFLIQWTDRGYLTTIHPSLPPSLRSFKVSWCWSCMSVRTLNSPIFTTYRQGSPCGECMRVCVCVCVWTRGRGRACTTGSVLVRADHSLRHHRHHHLWTGLHGHTARYLCLSIYLSFFLSIYVCLTIYQSTYLLIYLYANLSITFTITPKYLSPSLCLYHFTYL